MRGLAAKMASAYFGIGACFIRSSIGGFARPSGVGAQYQSHCSYLQTLENLSQPEASVAVWGLLSALYRTRQWRNVFQKYV